jgi:dipeptide/tripeptide permease
MRFPALRDVRYVAVAGVNAVLLLHMSLLSVAIPLWVTMHTHAPRSLVAILLVVNTVLTILFQVRSARGTETVTGGVSAMRRASALLALCCAVFATAAYAPAGVIVIAVLLVGITVMTAGELYQSAGGWSLSYSLAPMRSRSEYLSAFHLGTSGQVVIGPVIVTLGVINNGTLGWLALALLLGLAGLVIGPTVAAAARRAQLTEPALTETR